MKKDTEILADWAENFTPKSNFKIDDSIYTNCLMIDFAKYYQKQVKNYDSLDSVSVSPFSGEVINEAAKKWSESRSIGDTGQDRNCYYDFRKGMEAMFKLIQDSR